MPRIDDYKKARKLAVQKLSQEPMAAIARRAQLDTAAANFFSVPFLDRHYHIGYPDFEFEMPSEAGFAVPLQEQVLILHYLVGASGAGPTGKWIAYREIPGATFYFSAFVKRAINPLKEVFGQNLTAFGKAARYLNGQVIDYGDAGFRFTLFPLVPLQLIIWQGDEEFPPEGNILFDETVGGILSPEDIAWLAGMLVYRMISMAHT